MTIDSTSEGCCENEIKHLANSSWNTASTLKVLVKQINLIKWVRWIKRPCPEELRVRYNYKGSLRNKCSHVATLFPGLLEGRNLFITMRSVWQKTASRKNLLIQIVSTHPLLTLGHVSGLTDWFFMRILSDISRSSVWFLLKFSIFKIIFCSL